MYSLLLTHCCKYVITGYICYLLLLYIQCHYIVTYITILGSSSDFLQDLNMKARSTQKQAFAIGTKNNLMSHLSSYMAFCIYFSLLPFPLNCVNILPFLLVFSQSVTSFGYVNNVLSSIRSVAAMLGFKIDDVTNMNICLFMSGLKRVMTTPVSPRLPFTPSLLHHISKVVNYSDSFELCVWSAMLFMFFSFFRKSNVIPDRSALFDATKHVTRGSIVVSKSCSCMLVKVTWSKTIHYRQRTLYVPISAIPGSRLCPVYMYCKLCELVPSSLTSPAFVYMRQGVVRILVYSEFVEQMRRWLVITNVKHPHLYCSHSLRRGGATWAFNCGVSPELIKLQGDWQSDCYQRYIHTDLKTRLSTTSVMAEKIANLQL